MLKTWCLAIINIVGCLTGLVAQTVEETYHAGIAAYANGNYDQAVNAFLRAAFFSDKNTVYQPYMGLGDCYLRASDYSKAQSYYDLAYINAISDSLRDEIIIRKSAGYLLDDQPDDALYTLSKGNFRNGLQRKNLYAGIAWYKKAQFDSSLICFQQSAGPAAKDSIRIIFSRLDKINALSSKKAKRLSMFLPGLGQLYARDYKNSLNSFLLNAILLSLGGVAYVQYTWFDALLFVGPWLRRYYVGGYKKAAIIAAARKDRERNKLLKEILRNY